MVGNLVDRFGARAVTIASFLLAAVATVPFALAGPGASLWWLGAVLVVGAPRAQRVLAVAVLPPDGPAPTGPAKRHRERDRVHSLTESTVATLSEAGARG